MTDKEKIVWLAGLFEGEGYFGLLNNGHGNFYASCYVGLNDKDVMQKCVAYLIEVTDISKINLLTQKYNNKNHYRIALKGTKAIKVMEILLPYMGKRRSLAIKNAIKFNGEKK